MTVIGSCGYYSLDIDRTELSDNVMISYNDGSHVGKKSYSKLKNQAEKVSDIVTGSEGDSGSATWRASFGQQI